MRHFKWVLILVLMGTLFSCGKEQAPQAIQELFMDRFPNAADIEWEQERDEEETWEVEYEENGKEFTSKFDFSGWLETEWEPEEDVLDSLLQVIHIKFPDYAVDELELFVSHENGPGYEFEMTGLDKKTFEVDYLESSRSFEKKETEGTDDHDD